MRTHISASLPSPAELLYNRKLRSIVPCPPSLLMPKIQTDVVNNLKDRQHNQKRYYNRGARPLSELYIGQKVKARYNDTWVAATVLKRFSSRSYIVTLQSGTTLRRNRRHLIVDSSDRLDIELPSTQYDDIIIDNAQLTPAAAFSRAPAQPPHSSSTSSNSNVIPVNTNTYQTTRSGREVRPPDRWGFPATS